MSKTIDERVVEMKFDNSKFESGAKTTLSTLDKLKQALKFDKVGEGFDNISKAAGNVKLDSIGTACETVQAKFSAMQVIAYTALSKMTEDAIEAGKNIANALTFQGAKDGFAEYELKMGSVQTIMNGTGEDLQTVMKYLEELNVYADKTIYSFSDMTSNIGKFTNAGVKLEDAVAAIKGVSNEAAISGANANEASRAMYNFSQALSAGYVKLIDWKSIEVANMATVEFKNELIKTAVEVGTLTKEEDKFRSTTTDAKGKVSDLFDATSSFNESLSAQWMTTEVLTKTLAKYTDESTELGKRAYAAAQDVKTFSMMMDTLKEAIGSGWAVTWEKIIGDFDQAKEFFTDVTSTLSDIISAQADSRNQLIDAVMNKGDGLKDVNDWLKLAGTVRMAGGDVGQFRDILVDTARENGVAIDEMIAKAGNFNDTLANGWLSPEILNEAIVKAQSLGELSPEFEGLAKAVSLGNKPFRTFIDELNETSGRTHVINTLKNTFEALRSVIAPIRDAFREIFPPKTADDIRGILKAIDEFTKKLILSEDAASRVKTTFRGFFNLIKQGLNIVSSIASAFSPLIDIFKILFVNILDGIEGLGKFFNTLGEGEEDVSLFQTVLNAIHDTLESFANNLQTYIDKAKSAISSLRDMFSKSWNTGALSIVADLLEKIKNVLAGFTTGLSNGLKRFFDILANVSFNGKGMGNVIGILQKFGEGLSAVAKLLFKVLGPIYNALKEFFSNLSIIETLSTAIKAGGIAGIVANFGRILDNILDTIDKFKTIVSAIVDKNPLSIFEDFIIGITDCLGGLEDKFRSDVIFNFAVSIGILAASIFVLASIDAKSAERAVGIITALLGELVSVFVAIGKLNNTNGNLKFIDTLKNSIAGLARARELSTMSTILIKMAAAILILAVAMKMIAGIELGDLVKAFAVISALIWELVAVFKVLQSKEKLMIKSSGTMLKLAVAVLILAKALQMIASIDSDKLLSAFLVLTGIITELGIFTKVLNGNKGVKGSAMLLALAISITILAGALKIFATMDWSGIAKGLLTIAGLLIELGVALKFMKSNIGAAASLLIAAVAITILGAALKIFETIDGSKVLSILGLLGGVLAELAIGLNLMRKALPGAAALIVASSALLILSGALKILSTIPYDSVGPILLLLGGVLVELAIGLTLMRKALPGAAALVVAAAAIAILVPALVLLAAVPAEKIWIALAEIAAGLLAFGGICALLGKVSGLIMKFAAALMVLGVAVALVGAGLLAFALALGIIVKVGVEAVEILVIALGKLVEGIIGFIPKIAVAIGEGIIQILQTLAKAMPAIRDVVAKTLDMIISVLWEYIPKIADLIGHAIVELLKAVKKYIPEIIALVLEILAEAINAISNALPNLMAVSGIIEFLVGISLIMALLTTLHVNILAAAEAALALGVFIGVLAGVLAAIGGIFEFIDSDLSSLTTAVNVLSLLGEAIGQFIGHIVGGILEGALDAVSKTLPGLGEGLGQFWRNAEDFFNGMKDIPASVFDNMGKLALAIIGFTVAELINGVANFISGGGSSLAELGTQLSAFMVNSKSFFAEVAKLSPKTLELAQSLANVILTLTKAELLDSISSFLSIFTGDKSFADFGRELKEFGTELSRFSKKVENVNADHILALCPAIEALIEMSGNIENSGGLLGLVMGENQWSDLGKGLSDFGGALCTFGAKCKELVDNGYDTAIIDTEPVVTSLIEIAKGIPNAGGLLADLIGDNTWADLGAGLVTFGNTLINFGRKCKDIVNTNGGVSYKDAIMDTVPVVEALVKIAENIPNAGGLLADLVGDNTWADLGTGLSYFGGALKSFGESVSGLDVTSIQNVLPAIEGLCKTADEIPNFGGILTKFFGEGNWTTFANDLASVGAALAAFGAATNDNNLANNVSNGIQALKNIEDISDVDIDVDDLLEIGDSLLAFSKDFNAASVYLSTDAVEKLPSFAVNIKTLVEALAKISDIDVDDIGNFSKALSELGLESINALSDSILNNGKTLVESFTKMLTNTVNAVKPKAVEFIAVAKEIIVKLADGINQNGINFINACKNQVATAIANIRAKYNDFYKAGIYLVEGFTYGIKSKINDAATTAAQMAQAATDAARKKLDEHSPSKVFQQIGNFVGEGFVNGISEYDRESAKAGMSMVAKAIDSANKLIDDNMDTTPVIRPVLDLSDIEKNAGLINDLTENSNLSVGLSGELASKVSGGFNITKAMQHAQEQSQMDMLKNVINKLSDNDKAMTQNNTFNITGDDPRSIADEVSRVLQMQVERRGAVWA